MRAYEVPNMATAPCARFEMDPATRQKTWAKVRADGLSVIGEFHSHPSGTGRPSREDVECQSGLELIWMGREQRPRLWFLKEIEPRCWKTNMVYL